MFQAASAALQEGDDLPGHLLLPLLTLGPCPAVIRSVAEKEPAPAQCGAESPPSHTSEGGFRYIRICPFP